MVEPSPSKKWWETTPAILSALTALIGAIVGLIVALNQIGVFENKTPALQSTRPVAVAPSPPAAYQTHEHPFFQEDSIRTMNQTAGDGYCRNKFQQLKATGDLGGGFNPNNIVHVWAHLKNSECVANTPGG
jgi:hypothetical protein